MYQKCFELIFQVIFHFIKRFTKVFHMFHFISFSDSVILFLKNEVIAAKYYLFPL